MAFCNSSIRQPSRGQKEAACLPCFFSHHQVKLLPTVGFPFNRFDSAPLTTPPAQSFPYNAAQGASPQVLS